MRFERRFSTASEVWPRRLARLAITPGRLLGKGRLLEPKSAFEQSARLRVGTEKETEGGTLVSTRRSPGQFPLPPLQYGESIDEHPETNGPERLLDRHLHHAAFR